MANDKYESVGQLQEAGINVYNPEEFSVSEAAYVISMDYDGKETYQAVDNPNANITFESAMNWVDDRTVAYCEITADIEGESYYLYGLDDKGNSIGSYDNVESFLKEHFSEGFVNKNEFDEKLEIYDSGSAEVAELDEEDPFLAVAEKLPMPDFEGEMKSRIPEKADVPSDMEERVKFDFSDSLYTNALGSGFIPFEFREGFDSSTVSDENKLHQGDIEFIRDNYDSDFGMVLGVDTTRFDDGENGNIEVKEISYEDASRIISANTEDGDNRFDKSNIEHIKVYKEFGDGFPVDNQTFKVTNLVTVEIKLKDETVPYRNTFIADDTGVVRGTLYFQDNEGPFEVAQTDYVPFLDEYSGMLALDRQDFIQKVDEGLPQFFTDFTSKMDAAIDSRKPLQETRLENYSKDKEAIRNVYNKVEMYREIQGSRIAKAEYRLDNTVQKLKSVFEERSGKAPDSQEYKALSSEYSKLKNNFIDRYFDYMKVTQEVEPTTLNRIVNTVRNEYIDISRKYDGQQLSIDSLFSHSFVDDYGNIIESSYRNGIIENQPVNDMERFSMLCAGVSLKTDGFPEDRHSDGIIEGFKLDDIGSDIDKAIEARVDTYNEKASDMEKVHIETETGQIYTSTGFKVEPHLSPEANRNVDARPDEERFNPDMVKEDLDTVPYDVRPVTYGPSDIYENQSIREYANSTVGDSDVTRASFTDRFLKQGVYARAPESAVDSSSRRIPETKKDSIAHLFSGDDEKYFKAVCKVIDNHLDGERSPRRKDVEREKNPYLEEMEKEESDKKESLDTEDSTHNTDSSVNNEKDSSEESLFYKRTAMAYGKTDNSKDIGISKEKLAELRIEANREADGDKSKADKLFDEKCSNLKAELENIKKDIVHFDGKMESYGDIPFKYKAGHTYYQAAKLEYDSAIRKYTQLGGAVGNDCFVQKSVSKLEALAGRMDVYTSNIFNTVVLEAFAEHKDKGNYAGIYRGEDGSHGSYSRMNRVLTHYGDFFGGTVGQVFKVAALGIDRFGNIFRNKDENPNDTEKGNDKHADSKEGQVDKASVEPDIDKKEEDLPDNVTETENPDDAVADEREEIDSNNEPEVDTDLETIDTEESKSDDADIEKSDDAEKKEESVSDETDSTDSDSAIEIDDESEIDKSDSDKIDSSDTDKADYAPEVKREDTLPEDAIASEQEFSKVDDEDETDDKTEVNDDKEIEELNSHDNTDADEKIDDINRDESDSDNEDSEEYIELEDPAYLDETVSDDISDDTMILDEGMEATEAAEDPVDLESSSIAESADIETSEKNNDNAKVDAVADSEADDDTAFDTDLLNEFEGDLSAFLSGEDDSEAALSKIAEIIADGEISPNDVIDVLSNAIIDSMDDGFAMGTEEMIQETSNALDGSAMDNMMNILDDLSAKGVEDDYLSSLEGRVADSFEAAQFETDESGQYAGFVFDDSGVYDMAAGDDFYFPDTYNDIENQILNDFDGMNFNDVDQEFSYDDFEVGEMDAFDTDAASQIEIDNSIDASDDSGYMDTDDFNNFLQESYGSDDYMDYDQMNQDNSTIIQPDDIEPIDNNDILDNVDSGNSGVDLE